MDSREKLLINTITKMKKKLLNKLLPEYAIMLGAFLIFCSWFVQNFVENKYKMERENIEREKTFINELTGSASQYDLKEDKSSLAETALAHRNYARAVFKLFNVTKKYLKNAVNVGDLERKVDSSRLEEFYNNKKYDSLNKRIALIKQVKANIEFDAIKSYYNNYFGVCEKEKKANWYFVFVYAFGTVVSGGGMFMKKYKDIKMVPKSRRTNIMQSFIQPRKL